MNRLQKQVVEALELFYSKESINIMKLNRFKRQVLKALKYYHEKNT